jgi:hypothetical protein
MTLAVETLPVDALVPYARNARIHSDAQVAQIAASIREFGFCNPVLIDAHGGIIAGHGRVMAARSLGLAEVPCVRLGHLSDVQRRAYILADNKLPENAGWDAAMLELELDELADLDFDIDLAGFGFDEEIKSSEPLEVRRVQTGMVSDTFWISVTGPIVHQAKALHRLQEVMAEMPLSIELGTTPHE